MVAFGTDAQGGLYRDYKAAEGSGGLGKPRDSEDLRGLRRTRFDPETLELIERFFDRALADQDRVRLRDRLIESFDFGTKNRSDQNTAVNFLGTEAERLGMSIVLLRVLVSLENRLHRMRAIPTLSYRREFEGMLGLTEQATTFALRFCRPEDIAYREEFFGNSVDTNAHEKLVETVRAELEAKVRGTESAQLSNDTLLAKTFGVSPIEVSRTLQAHLSTEQLMQRQHLLQSQGEVEGHYRSVVTYAREELKAFMAGEIGSLTPDDKLAVVWGTADDPSVIGRLLGGTHGLSEEDRALRNFILDHQSAELPEIESLRNVDLDIEAARVGKLLVSNSARRGQPPKWVQSLKDYRFHEQGTVPLFRRRNGRGLIYEGHYFDSVPEATCAMLLKRYCPHYRLIRGLTYEVAVGKNFVDFKVGGTFVEYHEMKMFKTRYGYGDFNSREDYARYRSVVNDLKQDIEEMRQRRASSPDIDVAIERLEAFKTRERLRLERLYTSERRVVIERNQGFQGTPLVVATTPLEFYRKVVREFGTHVPSEEQFAREWKDEFNRIAVERERQKSSAGRRRAA